MYLSHSLVVQRVAVAPAFGELSPGDDGVGDGGDGGGSADDHGDGCVRSVDDEQCCCYCAGDAMTTMVAGLLPLMFLLCVLPHYCHDGSRALLLAASIFAGIRLQQQKQEAVRVVLLARPLHTLSSLELELAGQSLRRAAQGSGLRILRPAEHVEFLNLWGVFDGATLRLGEGQGLLFGQRAPKVAIQTPGSRYSSTIAFNKLRAP